MLASFVDERLEKLNDRKQSRAGTAPLQAVQAMTEKTLAPSGGRAQGLYLSISVVTL